jgi:proteasome lid subunit RPN8/RPN11
MATDIPHSYFYGTFQHLSATLVKQGTLQPGEHVRFLVYAFPETLIPSQHTPQPLGRFVIQEVSQPLSLVTSSLAYFQQNSQFMDQETTEPRTDTDPPVFFHPPVLDEAVSLAKAAGELETGGILIGHLHRDDSSGEIYLEVTAQIAAVHTQAQRTSLSFTPETWTAVQTALTLRKKNEGWLGWWHSHPNFCKNCPPEKQRTCSLSQDRKSVV